MTDQTADTTIADAPSDVPAKVKPTLLDEVRGMLWLLLGVLAFHSFVAKPYYIPSESMMPGLLTGDRLVVTKYPFGWSYVSPTIPNPLAIVKSLILRDQSVESWGFTLPFMKGRVFGSLPERGDVVILTPPGRGADLIKRVIGLPGDRLAVQGGTVILNGVPVKKVSMGDRRIPVDANSPCTDARYVGRLTRGGDGKDYCLMPVYRETLPNGRSYDTIDLGSFPDVDDFAEIKIPVDHVFVMGDNRDNSADSRVPAIEGGLGGPIPYEAIGGRAEFITFSVDGSTTWWNPLSWFTSLRGGRAGTTLHPSRNG